MLIGNCNIAAKNMSLKDSTKSIKSMPIDKQESKAETKQKSSGEILRAMFFHCSNCRTSKSFSIKENQPKVEVQIIADRFANSHSLMCSIKYRNGKVS
jgi:hypothetical protein